MNILVKVGDHAYIDPARIEALVTVPSGTLIMLHSGECVTLPGLDLEAVLDRFDAAYREVAQPTVHDVPSTSYATEKE